jgi:hypothetical protein
VQALVLQVDNSDAAVAASYKALGSWGTTLWVPAQSYAAPLGAVILGYWWSIQGRRKAGLLMIAIIAIQFVVGWVVDTKEVALSAPIILLLTRLITVRRIPIVWLACSALGAILVFPVLTAKREVMSEQLQMSRSQALSHETEILSRALRQLSAEHAGNSGESSQTLLQRISNKGAIETFVVHCGRDQPFKHGATLVPLLYIFVPRIVWGEKPGDNAAETFNRDYHISEDLDTHISPSHIGELYWNFGYPGLIAGEILIGILLGYIARKFYDRPTISLTGALVLILTLYELVARQEGSIGIEYVVWARGLVLIGLLHWLFARRMGTSVIEAESTLAEPLLAAADESAAFPNLMH